MTITAGKIKRLKTLVREKNRLEEIISDNIKTAQDRYGENIVVMERDGQKTNVKEKILWLEVFQIGVNGTAGVKMREKYPEIFENYDQVQKVIAELNDYTAKEFGFSFREMSLSNLIDLILAIFKYQMLKFFGVYYLIKLYVISREKIRWFVVVFLRRCFRHNKDTKQEQTEA